MARLGPILLMRAGALGDMVQFSAVVAALADYHDQPVDVCTNGGFADQALTNLPAVGRLFAMRHRRRPGWLAPDLTRLGRTLAQRGYSEVYAFDRSPVLEAALVRSGSRIHTEWQSTEAHNLDHYAAGLRRHGVTIEQPFLPQMVVTAGERSVAHDLLRRHGIADRPVIAIQPGNSRTLHPLHRLRPQRNLKSWPTASWTAAVAALASSHPEAGFALLGAPSEWGICEELKAGLPAAVQARTANLANELPVRTLAGLLDGALGCLSVDTGPAHLAAAVGCPLVVLFGPADPRSMVPRGPAPVRSVVSGVACSPCYSTPARHTCRENVCMSQLNVTSVLAAWGQLDLARTRLRLGA